MPIRAVGSDDCEMPALRDFPGIFLACESQASAPPALWRLARGTKQGPLERYEYPRAGFQYSYDFLYFTLFGEW